jgi:hypothetical protein
LRHSTRLLCLAILCLSALCSTGCRTTVVVPSESCPVLILDERPVDVKIVDPEKGTVQTAKSLKGWWALSPGEFRRLYRLARAAETTEE